jgi:adenine-specific DNA-methyltransferase
MPASYQALRLSASDEQLLASPYLTRQLIAYIGNKRRLLPLLLRIFRRLEQRRPIRTFTDPFSGSGAVARLGRALGWQVLAGDIEEYARVLGSAYLSIAPSDAEELFGSHGGLTALIDHLNTLSGEPQEPYISRHYAPASLKEADYRRERLFYTPANARFVDRVREEIERIYPEAQAAASSVQRRAKDLLLALLIYEAATHVNTSGVFKACHKGFGGHGGDALTRITEAMQLEYPVLSEGDAGCRAEKDDAARMLSGRPADLCYLDPPYNCHQYGSNYHLLNTIALWDKPAVNNARRPSGELAAKAAIRPDWTATRSTFCSRGSAPESLREVLEAADARWLVLSYNSEGIIPFAELYELLSEYGAVEIETWDYTTYRGGRQSISRKTHNQEFQLLLTRGEEPGRDQRRRFERFLREQRLLALLREPYVPERLAEEFPPACRGRGAVQLFPRDGSVPGEGWPTDRWYRFTGEYAREDLGAYTTEELAECCRRLERAVCGDRREEFQVLYGFLLQEGRESRQKDQRRILKVLRKFAHRKYAEAFEKEIGRLRELAAARPGSYPVLEKGLPELEELAHRRFAG